MFVPQIYSSSYQLSRNNNQTIFSEADLSRYLFKGYSHRRKPKKNATEPIKLIIELSIYAIIDVDLESNLLVTASSLSVNWKDDYIRWDNHSDFTRFSYMVMSPEEVWIPPFVVANSVKQDVFMYPRGLTVGWYADGTAEYFPVATISTDCRLDFQYWPFDFQNCSFILTSKTYTSDQMMFEAIDNGKAWNFYRLETSQSWEIAEAGWAIGENCLHVMTNSKGGQWTCFPVVT